MTPVVHERSRRIVLLLIDGNAGGRVVQLARHDFGALETQQIGFGVVGCVQVPAICTGNTVFTVGDRHRTGEPCSPGYDDLRRRGISTNLNPPVEGGGDSAKHRQGVAFVIGVLQAADDGGGGADQLGQFPLAEASLGCGVAILRATSSSALASSKVAIRSGFPS